MKELISKSIGLGLNALAVVAPHKAAKVGFELFCRPMRVPINQKQKTFFNTATKQSFQFKQIDVQTYRWGNGPKNILLLHGWQSHTYRWKIYIEALSKNYTIHAFDAPGHGLSGGKLLSVPLYSEIIEEQINKIGKIDTIITHSLGCFAAFYTFYRNPKLTANKIVAMASPGEAEEFFSLYKKTLSLSDRCFNLVINRFEKIFLRKPAFFSTPSFASTLSIPGLIIHDEDDQETSFAHAERIHQSWKNSKLIKTKGFGHNLKSAEVVREVIQFVNEPLSSDYNSDIILTARS